MRLVLKIRMGVLGCGIVMLVGIFVGLGGER